MTCLFKFHMITTAWLQSDLTNDKLFSRYNMLKYFILGNIISFTFFHSFSLIMIRHNRLCFLEGVRGVSLGCPLYFEKAQILPLAYVLVQILLPELSSYKYKNITYQFLIFWKSKLMEWIEDNAMIKNITHL